MNQRLLEMLELFRYDHLPPALQVVSREFYDLAETTAKRETDRPAEQMTALRKLLEAKDAAVRMTIPTMAGVREPADG